MNYRRIVSTLLCLFALYACAYAQDLKSKKDKSTKLYGYVNKAKEWVIAPAFEKAQRFDDGFALVRVKGYWGIINTSGQYVIQPIYDSLDDFDRNGLTIAMSRIGGNRYYGVLNNLGRTVLPVEFTDVNLRRNLTYITAEKYVPLEDQNSYNQTAVRKWGVYGLDGREIFSPRFESVPSFSSGNARQAVARESDTRLVGVYDLNGNVVIPADHLDIKWEALSAGYRALRIDLAESLYDNKGVLISDQTNGMYRPGYINPYYTGNDDFRAIAYGHKMIGVPVHLNSVKACVLQGGRGSLRAVVGPLLRPADRSSVDWGVNASNFVRLELCNEEGVHANDIVYNGKHYTVELVLYDSYGVPLEIVSQWGYIKGSCDQGIVYCAEDTLDILVLADQNALWNSGYEYLTCYYPTNWNSYATILGLTSSDVSTLRNWHQMRNLNYDLLTIENAALSSYTPKYVLGAAEESAVRKIERKFRIFNRCFTMGQIVSGVGSVDSEGKMTVVHDPYFKVKVVEDYSPFDLKFSSEEDIFWGAHNDRFVKIDLVPHKVNRSKIDNPQGRDAIWDDALGSSYEYTMILNLYEHDGTFVRTIAESNKVLMGNDKYIVLEGKIVLARDMIPEGDKFTIKGGVKYTNSLMEMGRLSW